MDAEFDITVTDHIQQRAYWMAVQRRIGTVGEELESTMARYASAVFVPVCGSAMQQAGTKGFYPDGFMERRGAVRCETRAAVDLVTVEGWLPSFHTAPVDVELKIGEASAMGTACPGRPFALSLIVDLSARVPVDVVIELSSDAQPSRSDPANPDTRLLGCQILSIDFRAAGSAGTSLESLLAAILVPVSGSAHQIAGSKDVFPDGFAGPHTSFCIKATGQLASCAVSGFMPKYHDEAVIVTLNCGEAQASVEVLPDTTFSVSLPLALGPGDDTCLQIASSRTFRPASVIPGSGDVRDLAFVLLGAVFM